MVVIAAYLLLYLYAFAWFVLTLAGFIQGDAKNALLFFCGSPFMIVAAGAVGAAAGYAAAFTMG